MYILVSPQPQYSYICGGYKLTHWEFAENLKSEVY